MEAYRPLPAALTAANRDVAGLLLYYTDKKAWREGRESEVIGRALRRVRTLWWGLGTLYAVMVTNAAFSLLFSNKPAPSGLLPYLLVLLLLTAVAVFVFRRGRQRIRALETELGDLVSLVPTEKRFAWMAAIAYVLLVLF